MKELKFAHLGVPQTSSQCRNAFILCEKPHAGKKQLRTLLLLRPGLLPHLVVEEENGLINVSASVEGAPLPVSSRNPDLVEDVPGNNPTLTHVLRDLTLARS